MFILFTLYLFICVLTGVTESQSNSTNQDTNRTVSVFFYDNVYVNMMTNLAKMSNTIDQLNDLFEQFTSQIVEIEKEDSSEWGESQYFKNE